MGPGGPAGLFAQLAQYVRCMPLLPAVPENAFAGALAEVLVIPGGKGRIRALMMSI